MTLADRIAALGFDWEAVPKQWVWACPICGDDPGPMANWVSHDRYDFRVLLRTCAACDHQWMAETFADTAAHEFYRTGMYRALVDAYHDTVTTPEQLQATQTVYAERLGVVLAPYLGVRHQVLLDLGGAPGTIADVLTRRFGFSVASVVDPALSETSVRRASALAETQGFADNDVITLCQTIDHVIHPRPVLEAVAQNCMDRPWAVLWVDIVDRHQRSEIKIDHPQLFSDQSIRALLTRTGWRVRSTHDGLTPEHRGYLCERT